MLIPVLGGPERKLAEILFPAYGLNTIPLPAWSPDSKHLVVTARPAPGAPVALFLVSVETGEKRRLLDPPASSIGDMAAAFSPDGRRMAFQRSPSFAVSDIYLVDLSADLRPTGDPHRLTFDNQFSSNPAWTGDGRTIVYASVRSGARGLWRVSPANPGRPEPLPTIGQGANWVAISRRAPYRLAYTAYLEDRNIWRVVPGSDSARVLSSTRWDSGPQFSPDGRKVAFSSQRSGSYQIWTADASGANAVALTAWGNSPLDLPRWSPDGRSIAFHARPQGEARIFVIAAEGGKPRPLTQGPGEDVAPSWSGDGRTIYFGSNRSGRHEIWKIPLEGGSAVQVTRNGGIAAFESDDRKLLYYTRARGNTSLWSMPLEGGPETQVVESLFYLNFAPRPEGLYFLPETGAVASIQLLPAGGGPARTVATLRPVFHSGLTVSPDGRTFLFAQQDEVGSDLMLVENFR